jgi:hypothetical protein
MESIQPSQRLNERTVGKDLGKIKPLSRIQRRPKDKIKLFLHPSSIPTKFQTIHYDDNEDKGFNSTANRFACHLVRKSLFQTSWVSYRRNCRTSCLGQATTQRESLTSMKCHYQRKDMALDLLQTFVFSVSGYWNAFADALSRIGAFSTTSMSNEQDPRPRSTA